MSSFLVYPTIKQMPIQGMMGFGGGATGLNMAGGAAALPRGSVDFDGDDYLTTDTLNGWNPGPGNWTIEFWWLAEDGANTNNHGHVMAGPMNSSNSYGPSYRDGSHNDWQANWASSEGTQDIQWNDSRCGTTTWCHYCFQKQGTAGNGNIYLYKNGQNVATSQGGVVNATLTLGTGFRIGNGNTGWTTQYLKGKLSNFRISHNLAHGVNGSTITVPTEPLEVDGSNTILLCCNDPNSVTAASKGAITGTSGDPTASAANPFD